MSELERIAALEAQIAKIAERVKVDHLNLDNLHERVMLLERECQDRAPLALHDVADQERAR